MGNIRIADITRDHRVGPPHDIDRRSLAFVAFISGFCGLLLGIQGGVQVPVESAQVLAGLVQYPADNPFYLYHVKTWTLWHQVTAVLLTCGLSERILSMMLGGLAGLLSFEALSLCCLAIGRNAMLAVLLPILCLGAEVFAEFSGIYPIFLISFHPSMFYGVAATALVVTTWSLYGLGLRRLSACLMGMAPAIHPTMGAWCLGIGVISLLWCRRQERPFPRPVVVWLSVGLTVTAASFCVHLHQIRGLPTISPELRSQYVAAFATSWDGHRQVFPLHDASAAYGLCAVALCGLWLRYLSRDGTSSLSFLMKALAISAGLSLLLALATHLGDYLPTLAIMLMPGRYINVIALAFPALALGMLARHDRHLGLHILCGAVVGYIVLREFRNYTHIFMPEVRHVLVMAAITMCGCVGKVAGQGERSWTLRLLPLAAVLVLLGLAIWPSPRDWHLSATYLLGVALIVLPAALQRALDHAPVRWIVTAVVALGGVFSAIDVLGWQVPAALAVTLLAALVAAWAKREAPTMRPLGFRWAAAGAILCAALAALGGAALTLAWKGYHRIRDWQSDPALARVHAGTGMVLCGPQLLRGMQLRTRRPVLLGPLNQLPYVPESAPAINHILKRVYNEDLLAPRPPHWEVVPGGLMVDAVREAWEARSPAEWRALAQEFGFTEVVVRPNWHLQLPLVAQSPRRIVYAVGEGSGIRDQGLGVGEERGEFGIRDSDPDP
jgi:hypothetical protein